MPERAPDPDTVALARYATFEDVVALVRSRRDMAMLVEIEEGVRLARYTPGRIEFEPAAGASPELASRIAQRLQAWTGARWGVSVVGSGGAPTIAELRAETKGDLRSEAAAHPLVMAVLEAFPGARIKDVRAPEMVEEVPPPPVEDAALDDDWDPFDPFSEED